MPRYFMKQRQQLQQTSFLPPELADDEGLVGFGGPFNAARVFRAYQLGIFPWYTRETPPLWWSPNPRAIIAPEELHVSRSLRRVLKQGRFAVSVDRAFKQVMQSCAREVSEGQWIIPEMIDTYQHLFEQGHAHSFEVWENNQLVGGLYGVVIGRAFAAESMFHSRTDASKVALIYSVQSLVRLGLELYDVQYLTSHLASLGAREIPRAEYLKRLQKAQAGVLNWSELELAWEHNH